MTTFLLRLIFGILSSPNGVDVHRGLLSVYWPNDSMKTGRVLACDTPRRPLRYLKGSVHVAMRTWRKIGCGNKVLVCAHRTNRCEVAPVLDSGPWGIYRGKMENAVKDGRWRVYTSSYVPPKGWKFRGVVDLSRELWRRLGRPGGLTGVTIYVPRGRPKR